MKTAMVSLLAAGLCGWISETKAADATAWETDYEQAKVAAKRSGKPILLTFR